MIAEFLGSHHENFAVRISLDALLVLDSISRNGSFAAAGGAADFAASAVLPASGLGASAFDAVAVASLFDPHPEINAAVTSAVRIVTLRMVGVCTAYPTGRFRSTAAYGRCNWSKNYCQR